MAEQIISGRLARGPKRRRLTVTEKRAVHKAVADRSRGVCEGCGKRRSSEHHHRQHGANGRYDSTDNLLDLCGAPNGMPGGNHSGCHGLAHSGVGRVFGWAVNGGNAPEAIPVYRLSTKSWTLRGAPISHDNAVTLMVAAGVTADASQFEEKFQAALAETSRRDRIRR